MTDRRGDGVVYLTEEELNRLVRIHWWIPVGVFGFMPTVQGGLYWALGLAARNTWLPPAEFAVGTACLLLAAALWRKENRS